MAIKHSTWVNDVNFLWWMLFWSYCVFSGWLHFISCVPMASSSICRPKYDTFTIFGWKGINRCWASNAVHTFVSFIRPILHTQTHTHTQKKTFLDAHVCTGIWRHVWRHTERQNAHTHTHAPKWHWNITFITWELKQYDAEWNEKNEQFLHFAAVLRCMFGVLSFILILAYACYLSLVSQLFAMCMCIEMNVLTFMMSSTILFVHKNRTVMRRSAIDGVWSFNLFELRKALSVVE